MFLSNILWSIFFWNEKWISACILVKMNWKCGLQSPRVGPKHHLPHSCWSGLRTWVTQGSTGPPYVEVVWGGAVGSWQRAVPSTSATKAPERSSPHLSIQPAFGETWGGGIKQFLCWKNKPPEDGHFITWLPIGWQLKFVKHFKLLSIDIILHWFLFVSGWPKSVLSLFMYKYGSEYTQSLFRRQCHCMIWSDTRTERQQIMKNKPIKGLCHILHSVYDISTSSLLQFAVRLGSRGTNPTCLEAQDEAESIILDFSTDNGITWQLLKLLEPRLLRGETSHLHVPLPQEAKDVGVVFRWWQPLRATGKYCWISYIVVFCIHKEPLPYHKDMPYVKF